MAIAATVKDYLEKTGTRYSMVPHPHTWSNSDTAKAAHVPPERIAKAVILADQAGYVMAVVPANRHVDLEALSKEFGRDLALAPEFRIGSVFKDCDLGAIPPLGSAYGMTTMLDNCLIGLPEVYFEAGDH
ncbi:MAG: YbaK/EbsC family protein, partial [Gammaproteobacteria bacterium]